MYMVAWASFYAGWSKRKLGYEMSLELLQNETFLPKSQKLTSTQLAKRLKHPLLVLSSSPWIVPSAAAALEDIYEGRELLNKK